MSNDKQLKDYLHLYLGCTLKSRTGTVILMSVIPEIIPHTNFKIAVINGNQSYSTELGEYKPILRPLSDMTEEEGFEITKLALGKWDDSYRNAGFGFPNNEWLPDIHKSVLCFEVNHYIHHPLVNLSKWNKYAVLNIDTEDGEILLMRYEIDGDGVGELNDSWIENQHEITRYLLKQGFDLFSLIPSGQAIDKTAIK